METKKSYSSPELKKWGTVVDLTQTGKTFEGADQKGGSGTSSGQ